MVVLYVLRCQECPHVYGFTWSMDIQRLQQGFDAAAAAAAAVGVAHHVSLRAATPRQTNWLANLQIIAVDAGVQLPESCLRQTIA
jgi:hypothetical protein